MAGILAPPSQLTTGPMRPKMLGVSHGLVACSGACGRARHEGEEHTCGFRAVDGRPLLPALWGMDSLGGEPTCCCAVVTPGPNPFLARCHGRMMCILAPEGRDAWMTAGPEDAAASHAPGAHARETVRVPNPAFAPGRIKSEDIVERRPPERRDG